MDQLGKFLDTVSTKRLYQEDSIDRLNYHYTVWLLLAFALTLTAKQYVGEPIQCWVPAEFTGGWESYTETYCFIENTYFVRFDDQIPDSVHERDKREIAYYQWVPFVLALEALMFYLPHVLWRLLNWQSGIYLRGIITMACDNRVASGEGPNTAVKEIAGHLQATIQMQRKPGYHPSVGEAFLHLGRSGGVYLTFVYLFIKLLFIGNLVAQFFILNAFLGTTYNFWGLTILQEILRDHDWQISGHFPRVTICDFVVRKLGNNHRYSVQCVLMINMFSEKIFLFLWWWFVAVVCATIVNFFYWLVATGSAASRRSYIQKLLYGFHYAGEEPMTGQEAAGFADYIGPDVVLVLRLISNNAGELIAGRVCKALYDRKRQQDMAAAKIMSAPDYPSQLTRRHTPAEKSELGLSNV